MTKMIYCCPCFVSEFSNKMQYLDLQDAEFEFVYKQTRERNFIYVKTF